MCPSADGHLPLYSSETGEAIAENHRRWNQREKSRFSRGNQREFGNVRDRQGLFVVKHT